MLGELNSVRNAARLLQLDPDILANESSTTELPQCEDSSKELEAIVEPADGRILKDVELFEIVDDELSYRLMKRDTAIGILSVDGDGPEFRSVLREL